MKINKKDKQELDIFYKWCANQYSTINNGAHPLNWISLAKIGSFGNTKKLPGLLPLLKSLKTELIGKNYRYTMAPFILAKYDRYPELSFGKDYLPYWEGKLKLKDDEIYLSNDKINNDIPIIGCWIIDEIQ